MKNRQRRFPLSYQRFATIVKMFCHGFRSLVKQTKNGNGNGTPAEGGILYERYDYWMWQFAAK